MPELPEVETIRRGIESHILQQHVDKVVIRKRSLRWMIPISLKGDLCGEEIVSVKRRGKYLLLETRKGHVIIHLGMSGKLTIVDSGLPIKKHDHFEIIFQDGKALRYNDPRRFGAILWTAQPPEQHALLQQLGPEPLSRQFTAAYLQKKTQTRSIAIKPLIMNSHIVVGVGNIYASEALFRAGIHPATIAKQLDMVHLASLVKEIKIVLKKAIQQGGTTLKDFLNSEGKPGYFRQNLSVYGRQGEFCYQCHTILENVVIQQRSSVYCPQCQK